MSLIVKQVSSMEKIRSCGMGNPTEISNMTVLKGQTFSYQIAVESSNNSELSLEVVSPLKDYVKLYSVKNVVMDLAAYTDNEELFPVPDDDYITKEPGMMPDMLLPEEYEGNMYRFHTEAGAIWVTVKLPEDIEAGEYPITIKLTYSDYIKGFRKTSFDDEKTLTIDVINEVMPKQSTTFSQWFHTDCIADFHNVPIYSEEHWDLIDKYMAIASEVGMNMILTPIITPPLDTAEGIIRPCVQLVKITKENDKYSFDFTLLKRWVKTALKNNFKYFEMSHLFSQWGLKYAPNIKVWENGVESYKFGWHTSSRIPEYAEFLNQFLPALVEFCKAEGIKDKCVFHISDEPKEAHIDNYKYAYDTIKNLIDDCPTLDALSDYSFYEKGLINTPVTANDKIGPFLENKVPNQWVYYCCCNYVGVGNRFLSMASYRNRILGLQIYKYNVKGFLQWGFNFYNSQLSRKKINPYITTSCDKAFPSGDPFSVYPVNNGVVPSLRAVVFKEALDDVEICKTLEKYIGREKVIEMIDKAAGMNITFKDYPRNNDYIPTLMEEMKKLIKKYI